MTEILNSLGSLIFNFEIVSHFEFSASDFLYLYSFLQFLLLAEKTRRPYY